MGFTQTIKDITHISGSTNSVGILDHFITSEPVLYQQTGVVIHGATDHFVVFGTRKKHKEDHPKDQYYGRAYSKPNKEQFKYDVATHSWDEVYKSQNPEIAWNIFKTDFGQTCSL